jgi:hypothetical protein
MTEAPEKPETLEDISADYRKRFEEAEPESFTQRFTAIRGTLVFWSVFMVIVYVSYVQFSTTMMSNGKSQFQRVAQSISSGN